MGRATHVTPKLQLCPGKTSSCDDPDGEVDLSGSQSFIAEKGEFFIETLNVCLGFQGFGWLDGWIGWDW